MMMLLLLLLLAMTVANRAAIPDRASGAVVTVASMSGGGEASAEEVVSFSTLLLLPSSSSSSSISSSILSTHNGMKEQRSSSSSPSSSSSSSFSKLSNDNSNNGNNLVHHETEEKEKELLFGDREEDDDDNVYDAFLGKSRRRSSRRSLREQQPRSERQEQERQLLLCDSLFSCRLLRGIFIFVVTMLNAFALVRFSNIVLAAWATRCFTRTMLPQHQPTKVFRDDDDDDDKPKVTIQICCYNEEEVIEKTINAACSVRWPKDKLVVQVLDDSTDHCPELIERVAERWRTERGINCRRLFRPNRNGYKAGSLRYHMKSIEGEFVVMLDSDHQCEPYFLERAIPHFYLNDDDDDDDEMTTMDEQQQQRPKKLKRSVGMVQTPWAYYNTHQNILTEYDTLLLDSTHVIEQVAFSSYGEGWFTFNGTGGIWRKEALFEAGGDGWSWETLAEDLDMSNMVYHGLDLIKKGIPKTKQYIFRYVRDLPQLLESPPDMFSHLQQKHRWTKGHYQCLRKDLRTVLSLPSDKASWVVKRNFFFYATGLSTQCLLVLIMLLVLPFLSYWDALTTRLAVYSSFSLAASFFTFVVTSYGKVAGTNGHYKTFWQRTQRILLVVPIFYVLSTGMCVFQVYAMWEGLTSDDATFLRTPKVGDATKTSSTDNIILQHQVDDANKDIEEAEEEVEEHTPLLVQTAGQSTDANDSTYGGTTSTTTNGISSTDDSNETNKKKKKKKKKDHDFWTRLLVGVLGLLVALYELMWAIVLFRKHHHNATVMAEGGESGDSNNDVGRFFFFSLGIVLLRNGWMDLILPLIPILGLSYTHTQFLYDMWEKNQRYNVKK